MIIIKYLIDHQFVLGHNGFVFFSVISIAMFSLFVMVPAYGVTDNGLLAYYKFEDISNLENLSNGPDDLGAAANGNPSGVVPDNGITGMGYSFDGSDDFVDIPHGVIADSSVTDYTASFWFKPSGAGSVGNLYSSYASSSTEFQFYLHPLSPNPVTNAWSQACSFTGISGLTTGSWNHIAFVWESGVGLTVTINGNENIIPNYSSPTCKPNAPTGITRLGATLYGSGTQFLGGVMDEVSLWNRALSSQDIADLYNNGSNPPDLSGPPPPPPNTTPVISTGSPTPPAIISGNSFSYTFTITDPEISSGSQTGTCAIISQPPPVSPNPPTYSLSDNDVDQSDMDCELIGTPTVAGVDQVTLRITDSNSPTGAFSETTYNIEVWPPGSQTEVRLHVDGFGFIELEEFDPSQPNVLVPKDFRASAIPLTHGTHLIAVNADNDDLSRYEKEINTHISDPDRTITYDTDGEMEEFLAYATFAGEYTTISFVDVTNLQTGNTYTVHANITLASLPVQGGFGPVNLSTTTGQSCTVGNHDDAICDEWELIDKLKIINVLQQGFEHEVTCPMNAQFGLPCPPPSVNQRDIYIEVDWIAGSQPSSLALEAVRKAFDKEGIVVHFILSESITPPTGVSYDKVAVPGIAPYVDNGFHAIKQKHFGDPSHRYPNPDEYNILNSRAQVFHYLLFVDKIEGMETTSGAAEIVGNDMVVALNSIPSLGGPMPNDYQARTIMHELGHNLGLYHGGDLPPDYNGNGLDGIDFKEDNCKPNYISVMNYAYQLPTLSPIPFLDFSNNTANTLTESSLNEDDGVRAPVPGFNIIYGDPYVSAPINNPINWDAQAPTGGMSVNPVNVNNIDIDGCRSTLNNSVLEGYHDWDLSNGNLNFHFLQGAQDFGFGASSTLGSPEITLETVTQMRQLLAEKTGIFIKQVDVGSNTTTKKNVEKYGDDIIAIQDLDLSDPSNLALAIESAENAATKIRKNKSIDLDGKAQTLKAINDLVETYTIAITPPHILNVEYAQAIKEYNQNCDPIANQTCALFKLDMPSTPPPPPPPRGTNDSDCGQNAVFDLATKKCVPSKDSCGTGTIYQAHSKSCVAETEISGEDRTRRTATCDNGLVLNDQKECVHISSFCGDGTLFDPKLNACVPKDAETKSTEPFNFDSVSGLVVGISFILVAITLALVAISIGVISRVSKGKNKEQTS